MKSSPTQPHPLYRIGDTIYGEGVKPFVVGEIRLEKETYKYIKRNGRINLLEPEVKVPLYRLGNICRTNRGELFCIKSYSITDKGEVLHKGQRYTENLYPYARTKNVFCLEADIVHLPLQNIRGERQFYGLSEITLLGANQPIGLLATLLRSLVTRVRKSPLRYPRNMK